MKTAMVRLFGLTKEILGVILTVMVIQVGLLQAFYVPTGSMEGTILPGEFVLADKVTLGPRTPDWLGIPWTNGGFPIPAVKLPGLRHVEQGDIVVVRTPADRKTPFVKRVVALEAQVIEIRDKVLLVDGEPFPQPKHQQHVDKATYPVGAPSPGIHPSMGNRDNWGPYKVPDDHVFLMGDNRDDSVDSRYFGSVHESAIIGRARLIALSINNAADIPLIERLRLRRFVTVLD